MRRNRKLLPTVALACMLGFLVQASPAAAERSLTLGITGYTDSLYTDADPAVSGMWLDRTAAAGAGIVALPAVWSNIAPESKSAGFDPTNPGDPAYKWDTLDRGVRNATAHGLTVLILVTNAPDWAEGPDRPPVDAEAFPKGTWKPEPKELGDFATAITRRYTGQFVNPTDALAGPLPQVKLWQVWAEPNLSVNLTPQWNSQDQQVSADQYRRLLNAFYAAAKATSGSNTVVGGGLAPYGDDPGGHRTRPLVFYRRLLCLHDRKKLKPTNCPTKAKLDVLAHNPINLSGGPRRSAINPDDVSSDDLGNVADVLKAAQRHHTIKPGGKHQLWATEFFWNTDPPNKGLGVSPQKQAHWIEEALYLYWKAGARVAMQVRIRDSKDGSFINGTGLYFDDGKAKPAVTAFSFPFVTERKSKSKVRAWGRAPVAGKLVIEQKTKHGWSKVDSEHVGAQDVFEANLSAKGKTTLRASVGGKKSLPWVQPAGNEPAYNSGAEFEKASVPKRALALREAP